MIRSIILLMFCMMMFGCTSVSLEEESVDTGFETKKVYDSIESDGVRVFYSKGHMDKAKTHLERVLGMKEYYNEKVGFKMGFDVYVFDRDDHSSELEDAVPYGMPFTVPTEETKGNPWIFMPATDDGVVTESVIGYANDLKSETQEYFNQSGYGNEEAIKVYTDLIILHEVGHNVAFHMNIKNLGHWFDEVIANYFVVAYLESKDQSLASIWHGNAYISYMDGSSPEHESLKSFDENYGGMHPSNYDWYQKEFSKRDKAIYDELGYDFITIVKDNLAEKIIEEPNEVIEILNEFTTAFSDWTN